MTYLAIFKSENSALDFVYNEILIFGSRGRWKMKFSINAHTGEMKNLHPCENIFEDLKIRIKYTDYNRKAISLLFKYKNFAYKFNLEGYKVCIRYNSGKITTKELCRSIIKGDRFQFFENNQEYTWHMPTGEIVPYKKYMRGEFIYYNDIIYAPFSLKVMKTISDKDRETIVVFMLALRRIRIKVPKFLIEMILKFSFETYEEIIEM